MVAEKCGKPAATFIPRWGISWACALPKGHDGECQQGGTCFRHGDYLGARCPGFPDCAESALPPAVAPAEPPLPADLGSDLEVTRASTVVAVKLGDRIRLRTDIRGGCERHVAEIVRRSEYAWLEYVGFPVSDEQFCDHCGEDRNQGGEPLAMRIVREHHVCWTCYLNEPVSPAVAAPPEGESPEATLDIDTIKRRLAVYAVSIDGFDSLPEWQQQLLTDCATWAFGALQRMRSWGGLAAAARRAAPPAPSEAAIRTARLWIPDAALARGCVTAVLEAQRLAGCPAPEGPQ